MDQIKRIPTNKWTKKYQVDPVFLKSQLEAKAIKYLKNQHYLDFKKISQILKINYNNKYPLGYALKTEKKIVGFVGTLFSKRKSSRLPHDLQLLCILLNSFIIKPDK